MLAPLTRHLASIALLALLAAAPAAAQTTRLEISPYAGWRWGGEIEADDNVLFDETVELDASPTFGVRLDIGLHPNVQLELLAARQSTEFVLDRDLFGGDTSLLDVDLDLFHVGALFQGGRGQAQPFGVVTLGVARLRPDLPALESEERLSATFGGGVKVFVNPNFGFRFEGRGLWVDIEENDDDDLCCGFEGDDDLFQGEVTAGLIVAF